MNPVRQLNRVNQLRVEEFLMQPLEQPLWALPVQPLVYYFREFQS